MTIAQVLLLLSGAVAAEVRSSGADPFDPAWSPDGRWLSFRTSAFDGAGTELWTAEVVGSVAKEPLSVRLPGWSTGWSTGAAAQLGPIAWAPAALGCRCLLVGGGYLLPGGGLARVYLATVHGASPSELVNVSQLGGDLSRPAMDAVGRYAYFVARDAGGARLVRYESRTAAIAELVPLPAGASIGFTPDGRPVVPQEGTDGLRLQVVQADGALAPLAVGGGDQIRPVATATGVAFFERGADGWTIRHAAETGSITLARRVRLPVDAAPAVSADGRTVAWISLDPGRGGQVQLTRVSDAANRAVAVGLERVAEPALAPDGLRVAVTGWRRDERVLIVADVKGGVW